MNDAKMEVVQPKSVNLSIPGLASSAPPTGGTLDHNELINRDMEKQHPIKAIDGLEEELAKIAELETQFDELKNEIAPLNDALENTLNGGV